MAKLKYWLHRLQHRYGLYSGQVVTWWTADTLWIGFQCAKCQQIETMDCKPGYITQGEQEKHD